MGQITAEDVLRQLNEEDAKEAEEKARADAEARAKAEADAQAKAAADKKPAGAPVNVTGDPALDVAWDIARDSVKAACPDLDEEDLKNAEAAAAGNPRSYRQIALRMQERIAAKVKAAKEGAPQPVKSQEELAREVAGKVFGDRPGGDATTVQRGTVEQTPQERLVAAQKVGDSAGVRRAFAENVSKEKLLGGIQIVE